MVSQWGAVVGELKDIRLCQVAVERAGDKLSPMWRLVLSLLSGMRRWCFLPTLTFGIPTLVINLGGDALSVCFNTVAVLFMCAHVRFLHANLLKLPVF